MNPDFNRLQPNMCGARAVAGRGGDIQKKAAAQALDTLGRGHTGSVHSSREDGNTKHPRGPEDNTRNADQKLGSELGV